MKLVSKLSSDGFVTASTALASFDAPPPLVFVLGRRLNKNYTGFITYRTGNYSIGPWGAATSSSSAWTASVFSPSAPTVPLPRPDLSACGLGLVRRSSRSQTSVELSAGMIMSSVSFNYFRVLAGGLRVRAGVALSTLAGVSGSVGADRKFSAVDRVGMGVEFGNLGGVTFRVRRLAKAKEENAEILAQRRKEGLEAQELMKEPVQRKKEAEELKNGLIIVEALYGQLPPSEFQRSVELSRGLSGFRGVFDLLDGGSAASRGEAAESSTPSHLRGSGSLEELSSAAATESQDLQEQGAGYGESPWIDVTIPVQNLVAGSQLHVSGGHSKPAAAEMNAFDDRDLFCSQAHIVGFFDPCFGERKRFRVTYRFGGRLHQVEVDDYAAVAAPLR
ncbi:hypothetical protein HK405_004508, partial [Cladochytrium tenue]